MLTAGLALSLADSALLMCVFGMPWVKWNRAPCGMRSGAHYCSVLGVLLSLQASLYKSRPLS